MQTNNPFSQMARASKLSIQDIQRAVQTGSLPAYVGIPLIEQKTKEAQKMQLAQAFMRQLEGGPPQTVSDSVLQAADQVTRPEAPLSSTLPATDRQRPAPYEEMPQGRGIDTAESNLPTEYAGGGIVAFAGGTKDSTAGDVTIPGKDDDKDLKAAGYLREAPVRERTSSRESRDFSSITPYGVDRPIEGGGYEAYTPPAESFGSTLSRIGSGIKDFASSTLDPIGGESESAMQRRLARESYYDTTTPPPSRGVAQLASSPAPARDPLAFLTKPGEGASSPAQGSYIDRLAGPRGAASVEKPAERPSPYEPKIIRGEAATSGFNVPPAQESMGFGDIDKALQDYLSGARSERQGLKELILGQKAERAGMEKENVSNALLQAGLGMMAARTPWALTNIGEGGMRGAESYAKGLDQLRARDDRIVGQLVGLGLKGAELENAALKAGIDIQHMKQMAPYYESMARQHQVAASLAPEQARSEASLRRAQEFQAMQHGNLFGMTAAGLPETQQIEMMKALKPGGGTRAAGAKIDPNMVKMQELGRQLLTDPKSNPEFLIRLKKMKDSKKIMNALEDPEGGNYAWALEQLKPEVDKYIAEQVRGATTSTSSRTQDFEEE